MITFSVLLVLGVVLFAVFALQPFLAYLIKMAFPSQASLVDYAESGLLATLSLFECKLFGSAAGLLIGYLLAKKNITLEVDAEKKTSEP